MSFVIANVDNLDISLGGYFKLFFIIVAVGNFLESIVQQIWLAIMTGDSWTYGLLFLIFMRISKNYFLAYLVRVLKAVNEVSSY